MLKIERQGPLYSVALIQQVSLSFMSQCDVRAVFPGWCPALEFLCPLGIWSLLRSARMRKKTEWRIKCGRGLQVTFIISWYNPWARAQPLDKPNCKDWQGNNLYLLSRMTCWVTGSLSDSPTTRPTLSHWDCEGRHPIAWPHLSGCTSYGCSRNSPVLWDWALKWLSR